MEELTNCTLCGAPSRLVCQRCLDTYCSKTCQINDWQRHRSICFSIPSLVDRCEAMNLLQASDIQVKKGEIQSPNSSQMMVDNFRKSENRPKDKQNEMLHFTKAADASAKYGQKYKTLEIPRVPHFVQKKSESVAAPITESNDISQAEKKIDDKADTPTDSDSKHLKNNTRSTLMQKLIKQKISEQSKPSKKEAWMDHISLVEFRDEPVEIIINTFNSKTKFGNAILARDYDACMELLRDINKMGFLKKSHLSQNDLKINELYVVINPIDNIFYRGVILSIYDNIYQVKLIDFGDKLDVTADKLKAAVDALRETPAYAIPIVFENVETTLKVEERVCVQFLDINSERKLVKITNSNKSKNNNTLDLLASKQVPQIDVHLRSIFNDKLFSVIVDMPELDVFDTKNQDVTSFQEVDNLKPGMMIVVKRMDNELVRALVLMVDNIGNSCIIYLCDYGILDTLIPIPSKTKLCPDNVKNFPQKALIVQVIEPKIKDKKTFDTEFGAANTKYKINNLKMEMDQFIGEIEINGKIFAKVKLFDAMPQLSTLGFNFITVHSPSNTPVDLLRIKFDTTIHALICPSNKLGIFDTIINACSVKFPLYTDVPKIGEMAIYMKEDRALRVLVVKYISSDVVEVRDLDNGNSYTGEWKKMKICSDYLKYLPVYTMNVFVNDFTDFQNQDIDEIKKFIDNPQLKKREYILSYESCIGAGVKLITDVKKSETLGTLLKGHLKQIQAEKVALEEAKQKAKLEEAKKLKEAEQIKAAKEQAEQEMKKRNDELQAKMEQKMSAAAAADNEKIFFNEMTVSKLSIGKVMKLIFIDFLKENNWVAVCEDTPENTNFLINIMTVCQQYVNNPKIKSNIGHSPEESEMCLTLYDDGEWYRSTCLEMSGNSYIMHLVDFGTITKVLPDKLIKMPSQLKSHPICTHFAKGLDEQQLASLEQFSKQKCLIESFENELYNLKLV